jgi:hypothetical protein
MKFEIISDDEVSYVKRGRKSQVDPDMVKAFSTLKPGKAVRITDMKGDPKNAEAYKTHKAKYSAQIRTAMKAAGHDSCRIVWTPDGVPQVIPS